MPDSKRPPWYRRSLKLAQIASIAMMWLFLAGVVTWILHLVAVSRRLGDALTASIAIGLVAIPVYILVAGILTVVFVGIQVAGAKDEGAGRGNSE